MDVNAKNMLEKRLLYTAISRAKKQLYIIGNKQLFETQVKLKQKRMRQTTLQEMIGKMRTKMYEAETILDGLEDAKSGNTVDGDTAISNIKSKYGI